MKSRFWMILIGALFALCLLLVLLPGSGKPAARAQIVSDGNLVAVLDLNTPQEFTVSTERGTNTVTVRDGKIAVTHADCPDQYCVRQGFCNGGAQIVCLPHRLVISFLTEGDVDGAVG